jgi:hypothetical protein
MGVRRHPVVLAAILSDFVVRTIEIAAAINSGRGGNLDCALIRILAGDLGRDLGRAREYARARHLRLDGSLTRNSAMAFTPGQAVIPVVTGMAYRCGSSQFTVDPRDPLAPGFVLR